MQMPAGEFKSKCLKLMDQVRDTHEEIVVINGDIAGPTGEIWDADRE